MKNLIPVLICGFSICATGCSDPQSSSRESGEHHHVAPHGGALIELGQHAYNLELIRDPVAGTLTAFVLDAHAENFLRIPSLGLEGVIRVGAKELPLRLEPMARTQTGETVGDTSQFQTTADWLKGFTSLTGQLRAIEIRGSRFENIPFVVK